MLYVIRVREFQIEVSGLALHCVTLGKSLLKWRKHCSISRELAVVSKKKTEICPVVLWKKLIVQGAQQRRMSGENGSIPGVMYPAQS